MVDRLLRAWVFSLQDRLKSRQMLNAVESYLRESCMRRDVSILPF